MGAVRKEKAMKHARTVVWLAVVLASISAASVASAQTRIAGWSESRAEKVVIRDALVHFAPSVRATLDAEILAGSRQFNALVLAANDPVWSSGEAPDIEAVATFHRLAERYRVALKKVRYGLDIEGSDCKGSGPARGGRYLRFLCQVTSETLEFPSVELVWPEDDGLPSVIEHEPRRLEEIQARLSLSVTGASTVSFRPMGTGGLGRE
jgi:hypothetical protein